MCRIGCISLVQLLPFKRAILETRNKLLHNPSGDITFRALEEPTVVWDVNQHQLRRLHRPSAGFAVALRAVVKVTSLRAPETLDIGLATLVAAIAAPTTIPRPC